MNRRIVIGFIVALIMSLGVLSITAAHADLERSEPAADAVLTESPKEVRMFFTQALKPETTARVLDASGNQVDNKDSKVDLNDLDRKTFTLTVPALAPGKYTVEWTSVSDEDGDSHEGSFSFTIQGAAQAQPTAVPAATARPTSAAAPTAQPTVAPTAAPAAGGSPSTLPRTGNGDLSLVGMVALAALIVLAGGLVLGRSKRRT
jgi:LPXTG-motif cell wall-anchored protein